MRRKRIWAGLLACLLCLGGCGPAEPAEETAYVSVLEPGLPGLMPDGETEKRLADSICRPEALASDGKTRILQTVGDEMTLHVLVEVTFAGGIDPESVPMVSVELYEGLPEEETAPTELGKVNITTRRVETREATGENSALYYFALQGDEKVITGEKTLVLSEFRVEKEPLEEPAHFVSWKVENTAPFLEGEVKDPAGEKMGTVVLSPFGLRLEIRHQEGDERKIRLLLKDGTAVPPSGASGGGLGGNFMNYSFLFSRVWDLEQIAGVQVGEYRAELP